MEICKCEIRLGGDLRNSVPRRNITPAEVMVLQEVHGAADAVVKIVITGDVERTALEEKARLNYLYRKPMGKDGVNAVNKIFPGSSPNLPEKFSQLLEMPVDIVDGRVPKDATAPVKAAVIEPVVTPPEPEVKPEPTVAVDTAPVEETKPVPAVTGGVQFGD